MFSDAGGITELAGDTEGNPKHRGCHSAMIGDDELESLSVLLETIVRDIVLSHEMENNA